MQVPGLRRGLAVGELGKRSIRSVFEHGMTRHASALAYQGLFALFPFVISLGVLLVMLQADVFFERLIKQVRPEPPQQLPGPLGSQCG